MREERKARFPWAAVVLFAAAAVLIALSAVGGARAALNEESENYVGEFAVQNIGVELTEDGQTVPDGGALLTGLLDEGEKLSLGTEYDVRLAARNNGAIDEYVRASVYTYWTDKEGKSKITTLSPALIELTFGDGWLVASDEITESGERTVLYYPSAVASGESTVPFVTGVTISGELAKAVTQTVEETETGATVTTTTYDYDGVRFVVEAAVDAVQTHSAREAIKAAWGVDATINADGVITAIG